MAADKTLFGQIVLVKGWIDEQHLDQYLQVQKGMGSHKIPLGELLVHESVLTEDQVKQALAHQRKMRQTRIINGYELITKVGSDLTATVYKARKEGIDKIVALRILSPSLAKNPAAVERFRREARAAATLNHPNVIPGHDAGESNGYHYLVMEYVEGQTVRELIGREKRIPEDRALDIGLHVAAALEHAAEHGLVHGDVKPDNIMVTSSGLVKLADLGLTRDSAGEGDSAGPASLTPYYCSPEQARGEPAADGEKHIDIRSDFYSLGATLHHMITGRVPFAGNTAAAVLARQLTEELPPLQQMMADFSEPTAALIRKLMAKDRSQRPQTPQELIDDIRKAAAERGQPATAAAGAVPARRRGWLAPVAAMAAVLAATAIAAMILLPNVREKASGRAGDAPVVGKPEQQLEPEAAPKPERGEPAKANPARDAFAAAEAFRKENTAAVDAAIERYRALIKQFPNSPEAKLASDRVDQLQSKLDVIDIKLASVREKVSALLEKERVGEAIKLWEAAKDTGLPEKRVDEEIAKLRELAGAAFEQITAKAEKLIADGKTDQAREMFKAVEERFGIDEIVKKARESLDALDAAEAPPDEQTADRQAENKVRAAVYAVAEPIGLFQLDKAADAYGGIRQGCPEQLVPLLDAYESDLAALADLKKSLIGYINANAQAPRTLKMRAGRSMDATSCQASTDALTLKSQAMEMKVAWEKLSPETLNELARQAAGDEAVALALLAHYTGAKDAAALLDAAAENPDMEARVEDIRTRFEEAAKFAASGDIEALLEQARALVAGKKFEAARDALKQLQDKVAQSGLTEEFGDEVEKLISANNESYAEVLFQKLVEEARKANWKAVIPMLGIIEDELSGTDFVRKHSKEIAAIAEQSKQSISDPMMMKAIRHFISLEDTAAKAIFSKLAKERKGTLAEDAKAFLDAMENMTNIPKGQNQATLLREAKLIPDPWQRVAVLRVFRRLAAGSRAEAEARTAIGTAFRDDLKRPLWAKEVLLTIPDDFRRYTNWAGAAYNGIGLCEEQLGNWKEAEKNYDTVLRRVKDDHQACVWALMYKSGHFEKEDQIAEAAKLLEEAVNKYPFGEESTSTAQYKLAVLYRDKLDKQKESLEAFKGVYKRSPALDTIAPQSMLAAADLMLKLGQRTEAEILLRKMVTQYEESKYGRQAQAKLDGMKEGG